MRRKTLFLIVALLTTVVVNAQSTKDWWYFGLNAGIHFTPTGPVPDTNGALNTLEGCASVSDPFGDLLFYTDGRVVYNNQHDTMPNGDSLLGNASSTQSSVIVPYPGNQQRYFIFTAAGCTGSSIGYPPGPSGQLFSYSVVDMSLDNGLGDVIVAQKNIILFDSSSEKITASTHANGTDLWVIGHQENSNIFRAYHVSINGVIDSVVSSSGPGGDNCRGYMLANHAGDQIVVSNYFPSGSLPSTVYDFDQATGEFQPNPIVINSLNAYGAHFSPNDSLLYLATFADVEQFNLFATNVPASGIVVSPAGNPTAWGGMAEGPDGRIYIARNFESFLARIEFPDVLGLGCNVVDSFVFLDGRICRIGLPNLVSANLFLTDLVACFGDAVSFSFNPNSADSVRWNFGDTLNFSNTSTSFTPQHIYSDSGSFTVRLIYYLGGVSDTLFQNVRIFPRQSVDLGPDASFCGSNEVILRVGQPYSTYLWQDGSTADSFVVNDDTTAWVTVFGVCDTVSDTIRITFDEPFALDLGPDTSFCDGASVVLDANIQSMATFEWSTGDLSPSIIVSETGVYVLTAWNACDTLVDSVTVEVFANPDSIVLPPDTINCFDNSITLLRPNTPGVEYYWSDSSQSVEYVVDSTETIWLAAISECGLSTDTINIVFNGEIQTELGEDTVICDEDTILLQGIDSLATYVWNTGDTADSIWTMPASSQNYMVTITLRNCQRIEQRLVESNELACPSIDCDIEAINIFTPNGDGINDLFRLTTDCDVFSYELFIYNRWGQLVHSSRNKNFGWDGFINGEPASEGVYYYVVEYRDQVVVDADRRETKGSFTLLRD